MHNPCTAASLTNPLEGVGARLAHEEAERAVQLRDIVLQALRDVQQVAKARAHALQRPPEVCRVLIALLQHAGNGRAASARLTASLGLHVQA